MWRRYAGWYVQDVRSLLPAAAESVGDALVELVPGGAIAIAKAALQIVQREGASNNPEDLRVALELIELAAASKVGSPAERAAAHR